MLKSEKTIVIPNKMFTFANVKQYVSPIKPTKMKEIERRIFVDEDILLNEYDYLFGDRKNKAVIFAYYKPKTDKAHEVKMATYAEAIDFARYRARDKRYRNFEFLIYNVN